MRKLSTWTPRLGVAVLLVSLAAQPARAQGMPTIDLGHIGVQLAEFFKKATEWGQTIKNYAVVKDAFKAAEMANEISTGINKVTNQVRDLTNQGLALQQQIQADLKMVANVRNLRVSNMSDLKNLALNVSSFNFSTGLASLGQTASFTRALASAKDADAVTVKEGLSMISTKDGVSRTAADMRQQKENAVMAQLAMENKSQLDKVTQAFQFRKLADELTASAVQLQTATNVEGGMSMTDGERLTQNASANAMLLKATEMREKAGTLMDAALVRGQAQLAADDAVRQANEVAGLVAMHQAMHPNEHPAY